MKSGSAEVLGGPARRLVVTTDARRQLRRLCRHDGQQVVLLTWPAGVAHLPISLYQPGDYDVIVGHVASCPIYADVRQLRLFADRRGVLDLDNSAPAATRPPLRLRTVSV